MNRVKRLYVEKIEEYAGKAKELKEEMIHYLGVKQVEKVRMLIRYDVENVSDKVFEEAKYTVFSEPPVDLCFEEVIPVSDDETIFSVEYLPGQFDQRADSSIQCLRLLGAKEDPVIKTAVTYIIKGKLSEQELQQIKKHCINPVDSRESKEVKPETLESSYEEPACVKRLDGFTKLNEERLQTLYERLGLAMTKKDFLHIQTYFKQEKRDPSMTEIRVLDTYWSDHCRHTTFSTELKSVTFGEGRYKEVFEKTYQAYQETRAEVWGEQNDKYICLMDLALIAMRKLKQEGKLEDQEESDEINACSIVVPIEVDGKEEEWLINFKNETHNHPTEIEPFGGAATCLGGAIRDPLSGRTYVYQAMRVTGAADPTVSLQSTLRGKLPQKKIVTEAASGYSSYGNQIGLATGLVKEIYHPDYVAKRMEIGAVLGAAPKRNVIRETSDPGDVIILLGGRTGRDGCGGATGSSKVHTEESIESCGAEVQKGNPPTERKIQRLFRRAEVSRLIKKCNDFGAGGVAVAVGELADGLHIDLDKVPKKYAGLDGTEIAISESQERMAVVISPDKVSDFLNYAAEENLEAVEVAVVTEDPRLVLVWRGEEIVNLSRAFLDTNGARQTAEVFVEIPEEKELGLKKKMPGDIKEVWLALLQDLNVCSQKGLVEMFDSSIGAGTVLMPYGGKYQMTEIQTMVAKVPVEKGNTDAITLMSYGFDPYISSWSPYHGAVFAVLESIAKITAAGGDYRKIRFTFQEYFRRMSEDPTRWSQPFAALLGAYDAQMKFGLPSIGGKDSMSGTFQDIDVPPTLVSFAIAVGKQQDVISPELKAAGNKLAYIKVKLDHNDLPKYSECMHQYDQIAKDIKAGRILSAYALNRAGIAAAVSNMAFGNRIGVKLDEKALSKEALFASEIGSILVEIPEWAVGELCSDAIMVGETIEAECLCYGDIKITLKEAVEVWNCKLASVFPIDAPKAQEVRAVKEYKSSHIYQCKNKIAKPKVFIPVFPGTNCEYDSKKAFERAGADVEIKVFKNLTTNQIQESIEEFSKSIEQAQIVMFPGGFSAGDEPDGSAKFFAAAFRNEKLKESIDKLLSQRDGLMLGICNGFQALIKLGLVPEGKIVPQANTSPTLTYNTIGRHISTMVYTKVVSNKSPWLRKAKLGGVYANPASHGEGRFAANEAWIKKLEENGQIATQYTDPNGNVTMAGNWNPNGSFCSIEGITSPDGRIFGKMAHAERIGKGVAVNVYGEQDLQLFESGVSYFC